MAKIVELMASDITVGGVSEFTVNNAVNEVTVVTPVLGVGVDFVNAGGAKWFEAGDNPIITDIYCNIPFGFGQGTGTHKIDFAWLDNFGAINFPQEFSAGYGIFLPSLCGPLDFPPDGIFVKNTGGVGKQKLNLQVLLLNVSQLNVPAALNGQVIKVQYFIELTHTKPLSLVP